MFYNIAHQQKYNNDFVYNVYKANDGLFWMIEWYKVYMQNN